MNLPTHSPTQTYTLTHIQNDCQKIPTRCLTKMFLSNTCYLFDLFPCISESAESCLIYPVDESLHVCFFFHMDLANLVHIQALEIIKAWWAVFHSQHFWHQICEFFPYTNQFSSSPGTNCVSYNSILAVTTRVSRQVKGSFPQNCPHFRHQSQISGQPYFWCTGYKLGVPMTPFSGSIIC